MPKRSAGLLVYKVEAGEPRVLLVHPGGPFWRNKDSGAWTIPKGEIAEGEDALAAACREFREETGHDVAGDFMPLAPIRQAGGKIVEAWAVEADIDVATIVSNEFEMEWPPRSGRRQSFPEIDRAGWFTIPEARLRINKGQAALLDELAAIRAAPDRVQIRIVTPANAGVHRRASARHETLMARGRSPMDSRFRGNGE